MQFTNDSLDAILDQANGVSPSSFAPFLRQALSRRDKERKGLQASGVTMATANSLVTKTFYALGYHRRNGAWAALGGWELDGLASVGAAMAEAVETAMPGAAHTDMKDQMGAAYVGLSRRGHGHFQTARTPEEWVDVFVFGTQNEATLFASTFLEGKRAIADKITGLVRK